MSARTLTTTRATPAARRRAMLHSARVPRSACPRPPAAPPLLSAAAPTHRATARAARAVRLLLFVLLVAIAVGVAVAAALLDLGEPAVADVRAGTATGHGLPPATTGGEAVRPPA